MVLCCPEILGSVLTGTVFASLPLLGMALAQTFAVAIVSLQINREKPLILYSKRVVLVSDGLLLMKLLTKLKKEKDPLTMPSEHLIFFQLLQRRLNIPLRGCSVSLLPMCRRICLFRLMR